MRPFDDAVRGVVFATILWFILSACVDAMGFKFIRELRWQVPGYCLFTAIVTVDKVLAGKRRRRRQLQFSADIQSLAAGLGLTDFATVERPPIALSCFEKWHHGTDGIIGEIDGVSVSMLDMTQRIDDGDCDRFPTRTIALLRADGIPALTATPRCIGRFAHMLGLGGMTFESAHCPATEANLIRKFCRSFRIEVPGNPGPSTLATPSLSTAEESVRRIMTPSFMETLLRYRGWSFQSGAGWLACWHEKSRCPPSQRPQFIQSAIAIRTGLIAAAVEASPVVLPPILLPSAGEFAARAVVMIMGMLLGAFGAFFYGIFRMIPRQLTGLQNILLILPFPMATVRGVVGGVTATCLSRQLEKCRRFRSGTHFA